MGATGGRPEPVGRLTIPSATARLRTLFSVIQDVDLAPTPAVTAAVAALQTDVRKLTIQLQEFRARDFSDLNRALEGAGLPPVNPKH